MCFNPSYISIKSRDERRKSCFEGVVITEIYPLKLTESFWNRIIRHVSANDREHPLVVSYRVIDLFPAVGRSNRVRTDHEDKVFRSLDIRQNFLLPLRRQRNVFPVNPGFTFLSGEGVAKLADEILVPAGIRREDLSHGVPSSHISGFGLPHMLLPLQLFVLLFHYFPQRRRNRCMWHSGR